MRSSNMINGEITERINALRRRFAASFVFLFYFYTFTLTFTFLHVLFFTLKYFFVGFSVFQSQNARVACGVSPSSRSSIKNSVDGVLWIFIDKSFFSFFVVYNTTFYAFSSPLIFCFCECEWCESLAYHEWFVLYLLIKLPWMLSLVFLLHYKSLISQDLKVIIVRIIVLIKAL